MDEKPIDSGEHGRQKQVPDSSLLDELGRSLEFRNQFIEALSASNAYSESLQKIMEGISATSRLSLPNLEPIAKNATAVNLESLQPMLDSFRATSWFGSFPASEVASVMSTQLDLFAKCLVSYKTPAIGQALDYFRDKSVLAGYESLARSYSSGIVSAPNLALLGSVNGLSDTLEALGFSDCIPRGTKSFVKSLSRSSIERLSTAQDITVNVSTKSLVTAIDDEILDTGKADIDDARKTSVDARSFNVISSSLSVFENLTEGDMMRLQQRCFDEPAFARDCKAGKFIWETIKSWKDGITFDRPTYYHARTKAKGSVPYLEDDMAKAPRMVVPYGRYNQAEKSYYYFADSEYGACREVGKRSNDEEIQIAELAGKGRVNLLDLTGVGRETNYFLKFVRFPFTNATARVPTEYLIPNYVSQCCRQAKLDGIKYYGSKDYNNYVVWDDNRLRVLSMHVLD